ncbi:MAG: chemotaxis protein CheB [Arenimonas sp.]
MKLAIAHRDRLTREALRRTLVRSDHELLWSVDDQAQMERECRRSPPALLLVELALLGREAEGLPRLFQHGTSVIALVSNRTDGAGYEALGHGALGLLEPPRLEETGEVVGAARTLAVIHRLGVLVADNQAAGAPAMPTPIPRGGRQARILALGASTGGPLALARILSGLPANLDAAVVIVQHIESEFVAGLAEWLASQSQLPIAIAQRGETPQAGRAYLAGGSSHLVMLPSMQFGQRAARDGELHIPSVDALFVSLAAHAAPGAAAVLTGMGSDGALGLAEMRRRGWHTLAQDEPSSVVYGMPRAALESGGVEQSLDLAQIAPNLVRYLQRSSA